MNNNRVVRAYWIEPTFAGSLRSKSEQSPGQRHGSPEKGRKSLPPAVRTSDTRDAHRATRSGHRVPSGQAPTSRPAPRSQEQTPEPAPTSRRGLFARPTRNAPPTATASPIPEQQVPLMFTTPHPDRRDRDVRGQRERQRGRLRRRRLARAPRRGCRRSAVRRRRVHGCRDDQRLLLLRRAPGRAGRGSPDACAGRANRDPHGRHRAVARRASHAPLQRWRTAAHARARRLCAHCIATDGTGRSDAVGHPRRPGR